MSQAVYSSSTSSIDNSVARFDGTSGNTIQESLVKITDSGNLELSQGKFENSGLMPNGSDAQLCITGLSASPATGALGLGLASSSVSSGVSGDVELQTGYSEDDSTGSIVLRTGQPAENKSSGSVVVLTADCSGNDSLSGSIALETGYIDSGNGSSGDIYIATGEVAGMGIRGKINLVANEVDFNGSVVSNAGFNPTTSTDWSSVPASFQAAFDQLAARVKALEP